MMNNIIGHAGAKEVRIHLWKNANGIIRLAIADDGAGFIVPEDWLMFARAGHVGLVGMREHAEAIGGRLEITSAPGKGTCMVVAVSRDYQGKE